MASIKSNHGPRLAKKPFSNIDKPTESFRMNLGTNGRCAHTASQCYKVTMASLQPDDRKLPNCVCSTINQSSKKSNIDDKVIVIIEHDLKEYILCILDAKQLNQCKLNLKIQPGEQVAYRVIGKTSVHLTGVYLNAN